MSRAISLHSLTSGLPEGYSLVQRHRLEVLRVDHLVEAVEALVGLLFLVPGLGAVVEVKGEYIAADFPAWTAVGVTALALPGQLIEFRAVAVAR